MGDQGLGWESAAASQLRAILSRAPLRTALVRGAAMEVTADDDALLGGVFARTPARAAVEAALGEEWVEAFDRVRETGAPHRATCLVEGELWDVWLEPTGDDQLAVYGLPVDTGAPARELLHELRNSIYGIRAAARVLLGRDLDDELHGVLEHIERAADEAIGRVAEVERSR